jgi:hypothetical protein
LEELLADGAAEEAFALELELATADEEAAAEEDVEEEAAETEEEELELLS